MADQFGTAHKRRVRPTRVRSRGRRLLRRLASLARLEARIALLRARIRARQLALAAALACASAAFGITAVVLLDVAIYFWLRYVLPPAWALCIMAVAHALLALYLFSLARQAFKGPKESQAAALPDAHPPQPRPAPAENPR